MSFQNFYMMDKNILCGIRKKIQWGRAKLGMGVVFLWERESH